MRVASLQWVVDQYHNILYLFAIRCQVNYSEHRGRLPAVCEERRATRQLGSCLIAWFASVSLDEEVTELCCGSTRSARYDYDSAEKTVDVECAVEDAEDVDDLLGLDAVGDAVMSVEEDANGLAADRFVEVTDLRIPFQNQSC